MSGFSMFSGLDDVSVLSGNDTKIYPKCKGIKTEVTVVKNMTMQSVCVHRASASGNNAAYTRNRIL